MDFKPADIWDETYKNEPIRTLPAVSVLTAINKHYDKLQLVARMDIDLREPKSAVRANIIVDMTPSQMRDLAAALTAHAARIEQVLMPRLQSAGASITLVPPAALYHEPETA